MPLGASLPRYHGSGLALSGGKAKQADSSAEAVRHSFSAGNGQHAVCLRRSAKRGHHDARSHSQGPVATGQECGVELKPQELVEPSHSSVSLFLWCFCFCFSSPPSMGPKKASNHFLGPGSRVLDPRLQPSLLSLALTATQVTSLLGGKYRQPEVCVLAFAAQPRP